MAHVRPVTEHDRQPLIDCGLRAFLANDQREDFGAEWDTQLEHDRLLVADDDGVIVGTSGAYTMELTLPGCVTVPAGGVTWVSVAADHRRQGILRSMMETLDEQCLDRGEPLAMLTASEGGIYRRFGYGVATPYFHRAIDSQRARFRLDLPTPGGVRNVGMEEALRLAPDVYDRARRARVGEVQRNDRFWAETRRTAEKKNWFWAVHPDGCVAFTGAQAWQDGLPAHQVTTEFFAAVTPVAHLALWRYLTSLDLAGDIVTKHVPADDPLPHLLDNPRLLRTTHLGDHLWVRPLDVTRVLSARRYPLTTGCGATAVTLDVHDTNRAALGGRFALETDGAGAGTARRVAETPGGPDAADLTTDMAGLGTLLLGGWRVGELVAARLAQVADESRLPELDRMFLAEHAPYCVTGF